MPKGKLILLIGQSRVDTSQSQLSGRISRLLDGAAMESEHRRTGIGKNPPHWPDKASYNNPVYCQGLD